MKTLSFGKGKFKLAVLLTLCAVVLGCAVFLCFNTFNKNNQAAEDTATQEITAPELNAKATADTIIAAPVWQSNNSTLLETPYSDTWAFGHGYFYISNASSTYMTASEYNDWVSYCGLNTGSSYVMVKGTMKTNVIYTMTFTAKDGYAFTGGAKTATLSFKATLETTLAKPSIAKTTAYYEGGIAHVTINGFSSAAMTMSGASLYATNYYRISNITEDDIGTVKTVTITLKDGFEWEDESSDPVVFNIKILKRQNGISLSYGNISVFGNSVAPAVFSASVDQDKAVFSIENGTGAATIDAKTGVITPTKAGTVNVTVQIPETEDYEKGSRTLQVTINPQDFSNVTIGTIPKQSYTGSEVKPKPTISDTVLNRTLVEGTDFEYSYENNTELGEATLTVTGKGNYTGTVSKTFTISPRDISKVSFGEIADQTYNHGTEITPKPSITDTVLGTTLVEGTDFNFSYSDNTAIGQATVTITGKGNYTGTKSTTFTILGIDISNCTIGTITACTYDGTAKKPTATVSLNGTTLSSATDFIFTYKDNINAGEATLTVTGKGNYSGKNSKTFTISPRDISYANIATIAAQSYTGNAIEPLPQITDLDRTLVKDTDYTLGYEHNTEVGKATITVTGEGNFEGTVTLNFNIVANINQVTVTGINAEYEYTGSAITPDPVITLNGATLVKGTDYTVGYSDNTDLGTVTVTITGKGKYNSTTTVTFEIVEAKITGASISGINKNYEYTGSALTPEPTVTLHGKTLVKDTDYTVTYRNNLELGVALVDINGTGNYVGINSTAFTIVQANVARAQVNAINPSYEQTGTEIKPLPVVTIDGVVLTKDADYTVGYENNVGIGTAKYTIKGIGNYTGSISGTFKITIAQPQVEVVYDSYNGTDRLFVGKELPKIHAIATYDGAPVEGTLAWDLDDPILKVGTNDYYWTFTPENLNNFAVVTGFKTLTAEKPNYIAIRVAWQGGSQPELFTSTAISVLKQNLKVTGIFSSGDTDDIAGGYSFVGSWDTSGATNTVKMPAQGGNNFSITVSFGNLADTLDSIVIKNVALTEFTVEAVDGEIKTDYTALDKFDTSSVVVTAKYSDGTEKTLSLGSKGYSVIYEKGTDSLQYGDTKVTLSFTDKGVTKTAEIGDLTVSKKPHDKPIIFAPKDTDYNLGKPVTGGIELKDLPKGVTVNYIYEDEDGNIIDADKVKDAGKYKVTAKFTVDKNYEDIDDIVATFEIKKINPVLNPSVGGSLSVGKSLNELTLAAGGGAPAGKLTWDNGAYELQEGTNKCYYTFTPDDTVNYNVVHGFVEVSATAPAAPVVTEQSGGSLVGWQIALIIVSTAVVVVSIIALVVALITRKNPDNDGFGDNVTWDDLKK